MSKVFASFATGSLLGVLVAATLTTYHHAWGFADQPSFWIAFLAPALIVGLGCGIVAGEVILVRRVWRHFRQQQA